MPGCPYTSPGAACFAQGGICALCAIDQLFQDLATQEQAPTAEQLAKLRQRLDALPGDSRWWQGVIGQKVLVEAARVLAGGKKQQNEW